VMPASFAIASIKSAFVILPFLLFGVWVYASNSFFVL